MKVKGIFVLVLLAVVVFSCKETVDPTLIITARDSTGAALEFVTIRTHPCFEPNGFCEPEEVNINFVKKGVTDGAGQVSFKYPYSAIIEVEGRLSGMPPCDTTDTNIVWCLFYGKTVAQFETKKIDKGDANEYHAVVVLTPNTFIK